MAWSEERTGEEDEEQLVMRRLRNSVDDLRRGLRHLTYKVRPGRPGSDRSLTFIFLDGEGEGEGREVSRTPREDRATGGHHQSGWGANTIPSLRSSGGDHQVRPGLQEWSQGSQTDVQGRVLVSLQCVHVML